VRVVATAAYGESSAELVDVILVAHGGDHLEALFGSCPMMAMAFFKMSR
jgi:hypothetical protein